MTRSLASPRRRHRSVQAVLLCSLPAWMLVWSTAIWSTACSPPSRDERVVVLTSEPLMASYIDLFNASQHDLKVEVAFDPQPATAFRRTERRVDVVIGPSLTAATVLPELQNVNTLFNDNRLRASSFYADLLERGVYQQSYTALPVAFNLPMLVFRADRPQLQPFIADSGFFLDFATIGAMSAGMVSLTADRLQTVGFLSRRPARFLVALAQALGVDFHEGSAGNLHWDEAPLQQAVDAAVQFAASAHGGAAAEDRFAARYLNEPLFHLLGNDRVGVVFRYSDEFFATPAVYRSGIAFRWYAEAGKIPVRSDVVYAGVPARAANRLGAEAFLAWLLSPTTTVQLLERTLDLHQGQFGVVGGFSALRQVTEHHMPRLYPELVGRLPRADSFLFPPRLPVYWPQAVDEVIVPYIAALVGRASDGEGPTDLATAVLQWRRRSGFQ